MVARVTKLEFYKPKVTINKNDLKKFRSYLRDGFYVSETLVGKYILTTKSKILVTMEHEGITRTVNLKNELSLYYKEPKANRLLNRFRKDLKADLVTIEVDSDGCYSIVENK